ncbi:MAG: LTA synthase family protein, partial [Clostridia bacterium]|nr:LTA synthase family protein [Clostridia bacterium]
AAVTSFFKETINAIVKNFHNVLLFLLPLGAAGFLLKKKVLVLRRHSRKGRNHLLLVWLCGYLVFVLSLIIGGVGALTPFQSYFSSYTETEQSVRRIGLAATMQGELRQALLPLEIEFESRTDTLVFVDDMGELIEDIQGEEPESEPDEESTQILPLAQVLPELEFSKLQSEDEDIQRLNEYFAGKEPTEKNRYTGFFEGYNLIYICAESWHPAVIRKDMMPTLYKLTHEGIVFENFYSTFPNTTTDGEYTFCMGNFPDLSRKKSNASFKNSADNFLPFALGNLFGKMGVPALAYHNNVGSYYSRDESHVNMGYEFISMDDGMEFSYNWPSSDYEMMVQSVPDYIGLDRFHAYYMTFSGHYEYDFSINPVAQVNQEAVKDLPYSETVKAYIACHLEVEKAMAYLLESLEAAGKDKNTLVVMTGDHFPYGLKEEVAAGEVSPFDELCGEDVDTVFEKYRNSFICWTGGLNQVITVDDYCSSQDILPTVLNLLGIPYDSRLLAGVDVLSDSEHMAILRNRSFISSLLRFDSNSGEVIYHVEEEKVPEWYLEQKNQEIADKMEAGQLILNTDYYRYLWEEVYGGTE